VLGVGGWIGLGLLEDAKQDGLTTRVRGARLVLQGDPARAIRMLEDEVLSQGPAPDVRRDALLALAAAYDAANRYAESERTYAIAAQGWPQGHPLGQLCVPWANMRVRAGRAADALELLDRPGATAGYDQEAVQVVARRAREAAGAAAGPR
jgi:hypothetical protein